MWKNHTIITIILLALGIIIAILDLTQTRSKGGWIALDLRGILIIPFATFFFLHVIISSSWIWGFSPSSLVTVHIASGLASGSLCLVGYFMYSKYDQYKSKLEYEESLTEAKFLGQIISLKSWEYVPDRDHPDEIHLTIQITESGRFSGNVEGRESGEFGEQIFHSLNIPHKKIHAGDEFTEVYPLKYYGEGLASEITIMLSLFKDSTGSAPKNVSKIYLNDPKTLYDGHFIYEQLPPSKN